MEVIHFSSKNQKAKGLIPLTAQAKGLQPVKKLKKSLAMSLAADDIAPATPLNSSEEETTISAAILEPAGTRSGR